MQTPPMYSAVMEPLSCLFDSIGFDFNFTQAPVKIFHGIIYSWPACSTGTWLACCRFWGLMLKLSSVRVRFFLSLLYVECRSLNICVYISVYFCYEQTELKQMKEGEKINVKSRDINKIKLHSLKQSGWNRSRENGCCCMSLPLFVMRSQQLFVLMLGATGLREICWLGPSFCVIARVWAQSTVLWKWGFSPAK